jgi:hypothetical protein
VLYRLRLFEILLVGVASATGVYFAFRQIQINRAMVQLQENQLGLQQTIEHQHREDLIAKYMASLETGSLSEQLGAAYALNKIEGDEPVGALARGLMSDFDPVGETSYAYILEHARNRVKPVDTDRYISEYRAKRKQLLENPSLRPRVPIAFDQAVNLALDFIAENPASENVLGEQKFRPWSMTVPIKKRPIVVERAVRLIRMLPGIVFTTTGEGYTPNATVQAFLPAESRWLSCPSLAISVTGLLSKSGYNARGPAFHRYDPVRAEAVRLLNQFRHAQTFTESDANEKSESEPGMIWAMGEFISGCDMRRTNFGLYASGQAVYGYRVPPPANDQVALRSLEERVDDFLFFAASSEKARSASILSLDSIRQNAVNQGLSSWWISIWHKLEATEEFKNLNGSFDEFNLPWDWTLVTSSEARSKRFTKDDVEQAKSRLFQLKS